MTDRDALIALTLEEIRLLTPEQQAELLRAIESGEAFRNGQLIPLCCGGTQRIGAPALSARQTSHPI